DIRAVYIHLGIQQPPRVRGDGKTKSRWSLHRRDPRQPSSRKAEDLDDPAARSFSRHKIDSLLCHRPEAIVRPELVQRERLLAAFYRNAPQNKRKSFHVVEELAVRRFEPTGTTVLI